MKHRARVRWKTLETTSVPNRHGLKMIHDEVRLRYDIGGGVMMASTYSKLGEE